METPGTKVSTAVSALLKAFADTIKDAANEFDFTAIYTLTEQALMVRNLFPTVSALNLGLTTSELQLIDEKRIIDAVKAVRTRIPNMSLKEAIGSVNAYRYRGTGGVRPDTFKESWPVPPITTPPLFPSDY